MQFWRPKPKRSPSLYLGNIDVTSASGLKKLVSDSPQLFDSVDDKLVERVLLDLVSLPSLATRSLSDGTDLALDITVADYDRGAFMLYDAVPVAWRPEIVMTARVYSAQANKTLFVCAVKQKYPWKSWFRKIANWRTYVNAGWRLNADEMEYLTRLTCVRLLAKVHKELG